MAGMGGGSDEEIVDNGLVEGEREELFRLGEHGLFKRTGFINLETHGKDGEIPRRDTQHNPAPRERPALCDLLQGGHQLAVVFCGAVEVPVIEAADDDLFPFPSYLDSGHMCLADVDADGIPRRETGHHIRVTRARCL